MANITASATPNAAGFQSTIVNSSTLVLLSLRQFWFILSLMLSSAASATGSVSATC